MFCVSKIEINLIKEHIGTSQLIIAANKIDVENIKDLKEEFKNFDDLIYISAKENRNIDELKNCLVNLFDDRTVASPNTQSGIKRLTFPPTKSSVIFLISF